MSQAGGDDTAHRAGVADWGLARIVENAGVTGAGGATVRADAAARGTLADLCLRADARRRDAGERLREAVLVHDAAGRLVAPTAAASPSSGSTRRCSRWPPRTSPAGAPSTPRAPSSRPGTSRRPARCGPARPSAT